MVRITEITSMDQLSPDHQSAFDEIVASRGTISGPFRVLLNSPEVARRIAHTGAYIRFESTLPVEVNELATITAAREVDCQYEWAAHEPQARRAGIREEVIVAIRDRKAPQGLTPEESLVVNYVQELIRNHRVSEATFQSALQRFGNQGLTDLTATIGYYAMLACALNAFEVAPEGPPPLPM